MIALSRRVACFAALALLAVAATSCGDNEPEQRKAFIQFLQTRIVDRPGVHVPKLSDDDTRKFGNYAAHYTVMSDFATDAGMAAVSKKMFDSLPELRSIADVVERRAAIRKAGDDLGGLLAAMDERYGKARTARDALKQPDDLKHVYDAAFDKMVDAPVRGFHEAAPIARDITIAAANVGDYVAAHRDKVTISGASLSGKDAKTQADLTALVTTLSSLAPKFNDAQRRLRVVLQGS